MLPLDSTFKLYFVLYWRANVCFFLYISEMHKAEEWGKKIKCEVNTTTYDIQVFAAAIPGSKEITPEKDRVQENLDELRKLKDAFIFRNFEPETLTSLGVPEEYIPKMYDLTANTWPMMKDRLPGQAFSCLTQVLNGIPAERVIRETYGRNREAGLEDIEIAANNPQTELVRLENEEEVARMLEAPLEKWRVFLHPQQRRLAYRHYAGSARVLGGAGTGKSVVAIHHAKFLASDSASDYSILFTTFTTGLTEDLKSRLKSICSEEEYRKITIVNLDALILELLKAIKGRYTRVQYDENTIVKAWKRAIAQSGVELNDEQNPSFFADEWINVIQAQDISKLEDYLSADRQGRGKRIDRETRKKLWSVFRGYSRIMAEEGWLDTDAAANYCCHQLQKEPSLRKYDTVIVDESPDFGPAQFRLLRALCGEAHADDMYITGDPRQQIYPNKPTLVLSKCGINVRGRGRSTQLILNYRTTGNILKWANRLLKGIVYDDLDGGTSDTEATISVNEGETPELQQFTTRGQEVEYVQKKISKLLSSGVSAEEIAVIARTKKTLNSFLMALKKAKIPASIVEKNAVQKGTVRVLTMHRSKGLEYSYVFVVGINKDEVPNRMSIESAADDEERERRMNQEKQLFHVALTRARNNVFVTCWGEPSDFLKLLC